VSIPINISGFSSVTAISLRLDFNPSNLVYIGFDSLNSSLAGSFINEVAVSGSLHKIMVAWSGSGPISLTDGSKMVNLKFTYVNGAAMLSFNNMSNLGGDCEFADVTGEPTADVPDGSYFFNATISHCAPSLLNVQNVIIPNGGSNCFNALQTITVAGDGSIFSIEDGGSATMIAGQNIIYLPTSTVGSGGYMHGCIAIDGVYCGSHPAAMVAVLAGNDEIQTTLENSQFRLWPNPTTGNFTLELTPSEEHLSMQVDIYDNLGGKILTKELYGKSKFELSLSDRPVGIYFIRVVSRSGVKTAKIIKQ
jgi:hypothetical protein